MDLARSKKWTREVQNLHPNNTNTNITNITTTKGGKDAVVAVNFKKLKEKGEEKMRAVREQMVKLDFKEKFIEKILKEYSTKKIEEKLDLLLEKRNIQNPAGWLMAALKNDYQGKKQVSRPTPHPHLNPPPSRGRRFGESVETDSGQLMMDSRFRGNDRGERGEKEGEEKYVGNNFKNFVNR